MARILLLGINSFSGYCFAKKYCSKHDIIGTVRAPNKIAFSKDLHIEIVPESTKVELISHLIEKYDPDVVINFVAMGNVDECERNQAEARRINTTFPVSLARILKNKNANCRFVQISSNAVYDGKEPPYSEDSCKKPVNYYGETKSQADEQLQQIDPNILIVRPITMFGATEGFQRPNPLTVVANRLSAGEPLFLVDDVFGNLLWVDDFVRCLEALIEKEVSGDVNIAGPERVSRYEFGLRIAELMGKDDSKIKRACSADFPSLAPRPVDTSFKLDRLHSFNLSTNNLKDSISASLEQMGISLA